MRRHISPGSALSSVLSKPLQAFKSQRKSTILLWLKQFRLVPNWLLAVATLSFLLNAYFFFSLANTSLSRENGSCLFEGRPLRMSKVTWSKVTAFAGSSQLSGRRPTAGRSLCLCGLRDWYCRCGPSAATDIVVVTRALATHRVDKRTGALRKTGNARNDKQLRGGEMMDANKNNKKLEAGNSVRNGGSEEGDSTVDSAVEDVIVCVLRGVPPFGVATVGGFVELGESIEDAAIRELNEETNIDLSALNGARESQQSLAALTQVHTYSDPFQDSRRPALSTVFFVDLRAVATVSQQMSAGDDASDLALIPVSDFSDGKVLTAANVQFGFEAHRRFISDALDAFYRPML